MTQHKRPLALALGPLSSSDWSDDVTACVIDGGGKVVVFLLGNGIVVLLTGSDTHMQWGMGIEGAFNTAPHLNLTMVCSFPSFSIFFFYLLNSCIELK